MCPSVTRRRLRAVAVLALVLSLSPALVTWTTHGEGTATATVDNVTIGQATNVTFVIGQGRLVEVDPHDGRLVAYHTDTRRVLWVHDRYRRYMDVDPLDDDRVLFVAGRRTADGEFERVVSVVNWRTDTELHRFSVPRDTHDVDALDDGRFAVADKAHDRITVVDRTGTVTWAYNFSTTFPSTAGGPPDDWTHLNDVDQVGDDAFLVSIRNFDRVFLLERDGANATVRWTLGTEDDYGTLYEQHNPVLLDRDPATVLVADSENDRVVEYARDGRDWEQTWAYHGDLNWPRDADRLPNGNTLVVDSRGDRVVEVTPGGEIVWAVETQRHPYDAERLSLGDEPAGPTMETVRDDRNQTIAVPEDRAAGPLASLRSGYSDLYGIASWVLPLWVDPQAFGSLLVSTAVALGWSGGELAVRRGE